MQINNEPLGDHCQAPLWYFIIKSLIFVLWYILMSENQRDPQYKLRWPEELRQKVAQSAKEHNRSMNADIVARLEESFERKNYDRDLFEKNMHMFLAAYCAGLESNYDEAIAQLEEAITKTDDPETIQYLNHRLNINKIMKTEINRLKKSNSDTHKSLQSQDTSDLKKAP